MSHAALRLGIAVLALVLGSQLLPTQVAFAHANLVRAEPAPNSVQKQAPSRVGVWFTEPIEPGFSEIKVLDGQGKRVDNADSLVDSRDTTAMSVTLRLLPNGTYTVAWKSVSAVDGHSVRGSFVFSVGEPIVGGPQAPTGQPLLQSPIEPVLRWLILLSVMAAVGGLSFELLVSRPVLAAKDASEAVRRAGARLASRISKLVWLAMGLLLLGSLGQLVVQTAVVHDIPLSKTLGSPLISVVTSTDWGHLWLWRVALLLGMAAVLGTAFILPLRKGDREEVGIRNELLRTLALVIGGSVLLTLSLASHGAATTEIKAAAVFSDYLHLLAAGFWVGGLFHFALGVSLLMQYLSPGERHAVLSALVPRFSTLAALSVGTLIITGIYNAWVQVTVVPALITPYGVTLLVKGGLIVPLLLLGALNLLWVRPRLATDGKAGHWLRRFVISEAILATLVLLSVGMLTSLEPARQVASRQGVGQEKSLTFQDTVEGTGITLKVEPGRVGPNRFLVSLKDRLGNPINNASDVSLLLTYLDADIGGNTASAVAVSEGKYIIEQSLLSIAGPWQAELIVRRPDAFDARTAFRFDVASGGAAGSAAIAPSPNTGKLLWGLELALLGFLFLSVGILLGGWRKRSGAFVMGPGAASVLASLFLIMNTQFLGPVPQKDLRNPFPPNPQSVDVGRQLYQQNCQLCHGAAGRGDGPLAASLKPPPLDLTVHAPLHPERVLFRFIRDGISGTAMPPWKGKLTDEEIWHVMNYVKTLAQVVDR